MKKSIVTTAILLVIPLLASAQTDDHSSRAQGYFFIAPIVTNARNVFNPAYYGVVFHYGDPLPADLYVHERGGVNAGFGGEVLVHKGLGLGVEFGYAAPEWSFGRIGTGIGSANASYHFFGKKNRRRIEPFVTGGYSLYFGDRTATQSGFNLGGGVNIWIAKHVALRLDIRDQDHINHFHSQFTRFVAFRVGVTFR